MTHMVPLVMLFCAFFFSPQDKKGVTVTPHVQVLFFFFFHLVLSIIKTEAKQLFFFFFNNNSFSLSLLFVFTAA